MEIIVWLCIDEFFFVISNGLLKLKNMEWLSNYNIAKWKKLY